MGAGDAFLRGRDPRRRDPPRGAALTGTMKHPHAAGSAARPPARRAFARRTDRRQSPVSQTLPRAGSGQAGHHDITRDAQIRQSSWRVFIMTSCPAADSPQGPDCRPVEGGSSPEATLEGTWVRNCGNGSTYPPGELVQDYPADDEIVHR